MCCPSNKVMIQEVFLLSEGYTKTSNNDTCQRETVYETSLYIPYREHPGWTHIVFAYTQSAFPATKRTKHAPISFSRPHINTKVHVGGGLKLAQLAREPASSCPKPCPSPKRAQTSLFAPYIFGVATRVQPSQSRAAPPISCSRSESGAYSRAPPVLMPSPLKTVWFVIQLAVHCHRHRVYR